MMSCPTQCTPGLQQLDEALTHEPIWFGKCQGTLPMHGVENTGKKGRKGPPSTKQSFVYTQTRATSCNSGAGPALHALMTSRTPSQPKLIKGLTAQPPGHCVADPPSPAWRRAGRNSPLEKKVLTMKLKEMEEMEKMARKVNTSVGSLLVSTAPCSLTCQKNGVRRGAGTVSLVSSVG